MTRLFVNENDPFLAEIDYIVMVPNALTEAQMTSLYSTYSQGADIETFLSDNSLTPTVKYTFENDNTNTGTATGLPPFRSKPRTRTGGIDRKIPSVDVHVVT